LSIKKRVAYLWIGGVCID